jgi:hypothetical protein
VEPQHEQLQDVVVARYQLKGGNRFKPDAGPDDWREAAVDS